MSDTGVVAPGGGDTTCMEFRRDEVLAVPVPVLRSALFFLSLFMSSLSFFSSLDHLPALPLVGVVCSALSGVTDFSSSGSISLGSGAPMFLYTEEMLRWAYMYQFIQPLIDNFSTVRLLPGIWTWWKNIYILTGHLERMLQICTVLQTRLRAELFF